MASFESFVKRFGVLAAICGKEGLINEEFIDLYHRLLTQRYSYQQICDALDKLALELTPTSPIPSVRLIIETIEGKSIGCAVIRPEALIDAEAREAASRVICAVSKFGYSQPEAAKEWMGSLGWFIVDRAGGWNNLCEFLDHDNQGMHEAQFRELAKAQILRSRAGITSTPSLPMSEQNNSVALNSASQTGDLIKELCSGLRQLPEKR